MEFFFRFKTELTLACIENMAAQSENTQLSFRRIKSRKNKMLERFGVYCFSHFCFVHSVNLPILSVRSRSQMHRLHSKMHRIVNDA